MRVRDLMTRGVITVQAGDSVETARRQLKQHGIHHLVVMDDERLVGVLTYPELLGRKDTQRVEQVMARDVVTVGPDETIRKAAALMLGRTHGCVAVVEHGAVTGVLTTTDLRRAVTTGSGMV